jgi:hypothetical protein
LKHFALHGLQQGGPHTAKQTVHSCGASPEPLVADNVQEFFMTQDLVSITFSQEKLAAIDAAITQLETLLAELVSLTPDERRSLRRMGVVSEPFCRQTLVVMQQNPHVIPASVNLAGGVEDLTTLDALAPRLDRLQRLAERGNDTEAALGSDLMSLASEGYALLKVAGKSQGLDGLRKELSVRFRRKRAATEPKTDDKAEKDA